MRTFSGPEQFDALKQTVVEAYQKLFPVQKDPNGPSLTLNKIWVDDHVLDPHDYVDQKKSRLSGNTWGAPVYASLELKDGGGKVIDRMDKVRLATIPRLTPRGSYIVGGNEYQVANQLRMRMGPYILRSQKGDQYKAVINLGGEFNKRPEIHYDPVSNKLTTKVDKGALPLYPLMHAMGVTDEEMRKAWGSEIFAANKVDPNKFILKYAERFTRTRTDNPATASEAIKNYAKTATTDPKVSDITLGKPYAHLHAGMLVDTSQKLLHVYQEKAEPDDPENLLFKEVLSADDMLKDYLSQKQKSNLKFMLSRHLGKRTLIKDMIDFKKLSAPVEYFFTHDDRVSTPEQYNPVHMLSETHKLTMTGTGGIRDPHTITPEVREVHPSHVGFVDPVHTPESEKIGVMLHLTAAAMKEGRDVKTPVINTKTFKTEYLTPLELYKKHVAFPDEAKLENGKVKWKSSEVKTQKLGKLAVIKPSEVEYVLPAQSALFSHSTNLIPFLQNDQGNRAMMGTKHLGQAIPLVEREAPLVQTDIGNGTTFHQAIGEQFSVHAPIDGKITKITPDHIEIGKHKIPLYNDFPLNQKTYLHHDPVVKIGDSVKKGQLLADSNFTKGGTLALGKNLTVAYLPYPGLTFEDGIVITESAAKKLSSQHIYKHTFETEAGARMTDYKKYMAYYHNTVHKDLRPKFDDDGVIKKGSIINPNDLVIMGLKYDLASPENASLKRINKALQRPWSNAGVKYKGEFQGVVTDVVKRAGQVDVFVKSVEPAKESDKLSGVHGNKGVITKIIQDSEAPRLANGTVPDVFLNPHGIIGRINLGQIYESSAAKIAEKNKKTYVTKNFSGEAINEKIQAEMKKAGLSDMEDMYLPNGKPIGKVHVGKPYILRLAKTGKSGFSARMPMTSYDINRQPTKGGEEGTKALDAMTFYSMLSHGAKKNLIDAHQKSEQNDEYWHAIESGKPLPAPHTTFAYNKFLSLLHGAGINTVKQGQDITLAPLTDDTVRKLSKGAIEEPEFLYGKDLKEKRGGFFDPVITGGKFGTNYAHINLPEAMPNPVFEKAIQKLTGLKYGDYSDIVSGLKHVSQEGAISTAPAKGSVTGGPGIARLLKKIDIDRDLGKFKDELKKAKTEPEIDDLNRKMRYLSALKDLNLSPEEAYMRKTVPVIPPQYRPIYEIPKRGLTISPVNYLYQGVGLLSKAHDYDVMKLLPDSEKSDMKRDMYKSTRALAGLEPVLTRSKDYPMEGFISQISGSKPKKGFFYSKILDRRQDLVGRGVITSAPDFDVDELGIPEKMAWNIFRPFIVREYTAAGIGADIARKEIEVKDPRAKQMLQSAMSKRTVLMNRAPSLHKFSIMAFKPRLTEGLAVRVPPLVLKGFGGDFDGDAVTIHVPTSDEAVVESKKMFPSNNLFKPGTGELMIMPSQESAIGLYFLSQSADGRKKINELLPEKFRIAGELSAKAAKDLYNKIAKEAPKEYHKHVFDLKQLGDKTAYERGFSVGLKDLVVDTAVRDKVFAAADKKASDVRRRIKAGPEQDKVVSKLYSDASKEAYEIIKKDLKHRDNNFYHMVTSGARGKDSQLMQLISAPGTVEGAKNRPIPIPIRKSYAEGLDTGDYFVSSYGVRKGMTDRVLQTSEPGALNKEIMASTLDNIVTVGDCGTEHGIDLPVASKESYGRFLSKPQAGFARNTLVTPQVLSAMTRKGVKSLHVRSPLKCVAPKGTCAHCYGLDEHEQIPALGDNIGAKTGQAMSEPMTQMTMKCSSGCITDANGITWSFVDYYESRDCGEEIYDGHCYSKHGEFWVKDAGRTVRSDVIQTHPPEDRMLFIKTKRGHTLVVQANHPLWAYNKNGDIFELPASQLSLNDYLLTSGEALDGEDPAPFNPYILGLFLAEGSTRYGNGTKKYEGVPVATIITQRNNSIKEKAWEILKDLKGARRHEKDIQIYNPAFALELSGYVRGREAKLKRLMPGFNRWKKEDLAQLLAGWIDGDGTVFTRNRTTAKIYTCSYYALQQLEIICHKLGATFTPQLLKQREMHRTQHFCAEIRFRDNSVYKHSIKMQQCEFKETTRIIDNEELDQVVQVKEIWCWEMPVWDIQTETHGYTCGMLRNHNTFHTGGVAGEAPVAKGFERIKQLLEMPRHTAGEATLSRTEGKVSKIQSMEAGGYEIHVGNEIHKVPPQRELKVKVGEHVRAGDTLSTGVIKPQELVKYKGMAAAQDYIVDELHKAYEGQGIPMQRKIFETVVRSVGNLTRVIHAPKQAGFNPGDIIPYTTAAHYNDHLAEKRHISDSTGYHLQFPIGNLPQFHEITDKDVSYLNGLGYNQVDVLKDPLRHAPILTGIDRLPISKKNWMAQLGYRRIKNTLTDGSAEAWKTKIQDAHPVPAFAYGATFGQKKEHY